MPGCAFLGMREIRLQASVLSNVAPLFLQLFKVCTNGILPSAKLVMCLQKMHLERHIYHESKDHVCAWAPHFSGMLRAVSKNFRDIAESPEKKRMCFAKVLHGLALNRLGILSDTYGKMCLDMHASAMAVILRCFYTCRPICFMDSNRDWSHMDITCVRWVTFYAMWSVVCVFAMLYFSIILFTCYD